MSEPVKITNIIVIHDSPPLRPRHEHQWAWAMMTSGRTVPVCYTCGKERT